MAVDLNEVKINIRSLLTSSQKPLSISQLQRDYREQEGCNLPYKTLGFSSVIELLQNMDDVVTVPPNPNESSTLSLVVGDKTNHLRMLVVKQKTCTKKKKAKSNKNSQIMYKTCNRNNNFYGCNSSNKTMSTKTNNYSNSISQNTRHDYHRSNNFSISSNQLKQSCSSSRKSYSDMKNDFNRNAISRTGYVTDKLRSDIERYILENQMSITVDKLKEIVKHHSDYSVMNVKSMQELKSLVEGFLNISDTSVSLKGTHYFETNISVIDHDTDAQIKPLKSSDANKIIYTNSLPSLLVPNQINGCEKNVISSRPYIWNDENTVSELYTRLTTNTFKEDTSHTNYQNDCNYGINSETNRAIESSTEYINMCKNQNMMRTFQSGHINTEKNSDVAITNLRKDIEYFEKKQSENRKNKIVDTGLLNGNKSQSYSITINGNNSSDNSNSYFHSTPKKKNNNKIKLNETQCIPELVRLQIARIFKVYCNGVNIENFKFIYTELYHTIFNPTDFGFISIIQMLKALDQIIEVRNNVLYTINEFKLYENVDLKNENRGLLTNICLNTEKISTIIEQPTFFFNQEKKKMLLVEIYNPSLFYLQLQYKRVELDRLMTQMQNFYDMKNKNYLVNPEQILPGLFYATSYTSFLSLKQWYRVRVLRKVNSTTVEVIHADFGTVDIIPITELRFLDYKFCSLPCQAIQCCLSGYNELDSISLDVTKAFLEIININKQVLVMVDNHFILSNQCQILHVTLFQYKSNNSTKLENINNELTVWHLNR